MKKLIIIGIALVSLLSCEKELPPPTPVEPPIVDTIPEPEPIEQDKYIYTEWYGNTGLYATVFLNGSSIGGYSTNGYLNGSFAFIAYEGDIIMLEIKTYQSVSTGPAINGNISYKIKVDGVQKDNGMQMNTSVLNATYIIE